MAKPPRRGVLLTVPHRTQLVGRELLHQAAWLHPLFTLLPCAPPNRVPLLIFVAPFLSALHHTLATLLSQPREHVTAYVDDSTAADSPKDFQRLHKRFAAEMSCGLTVSSPRSPMSLLLYVYDDSHAFLVALAEVRDRFWHNALPYFERVLDATFLEHEASIETVINDYVMGAVQVGPLVCTSLGCHSCWRHQHADTLATF
jgi:hypothetical protein